MPTNFAKCPVAFVEQAFRGIACGLADQSLAIGAVGETVAALGGVKKPKREWYNPWLIFAQESQKSYCSAVVADTFFALVKAGKVPQWAMYQEDLKAMQAVRSGN